MDCVLPASAVSEDADLSWSDNNSVTSAVSEDHLYRGATTTTTTTTTSASTHTPLSTSLPSSCSSLASLSSLSSSSASSPPNVAMAMAATWMSNHQHQSSHAHHNLHHYDFHHYDSQQRHQLQRRGPSQHHHEHEHRHYRHHGYHERHHSHGGPSHQGSSHHSHTITSQLSPVSTGMMDITLEPLPTAAPSMAHSASTSSSCTADSWSNDGYGDRDDDAGQDMDTDMQWEQSPDHMRMLTVPKLEPADEDYVLDHVKAAPADDGEASARPSALGAGTNDHLTTTAPPIKQKRPRGRPRKHPLNTMANSSKIAKGRSKTGCITCRRRKKKCDEAKPRCMNCEKNAVFCEGYHEKQIWKSGKEKAEEERLRRESFPSITIQPLFHAVETVEDKVFWRHYFHHLSNVLTVEGEAKNAFKDIILQIATRHKGLMHSILSVSSRHIDFDTPYGTKLLQDHPETSLEALHSRSDYHHEQAMKHLYRDMARPVDRDDPEYGTVLSARYGQMICLVLQTRAEGNPRGEHRVHLQAYQKLIRHSPPEDSGFLNFISEFFDYHIYADELIWHPDMPTRRLAANQPPVEDPWALPPPAMHSGCSGGPVTPRPSTPTSNDGDDGGSTKTEHPPRLLGVFDGLFQYLTQITTMRNAIRSNIAAGVDPVVDYTCLYQAAEIDAAIREWKPHWPPGDSRERVGLLYKQMMWVYLFRTIYPPSPSLAPPSTAVSGPCSGRNSPASCATSRRSATSSSLQTPSLGPSSPTGASPQYKPKKTPTHPPTPKTPISPAITVATRPSTSSSSLGFPKSTACYATCSDQDLPGVSSRPSSPPPIRRPPQHDRRITVAVDEALDLLESFKPSDPSQTLLLIPCLIVGTAAFDPAQRERVRAAVRTVKGYTGLRNCDRVMELLIALWRLMEAGEWMSVWDWQGVARHKGLDFLCA